MNKKKLQQQHFEEAQTRARSVTVGTAFGGTTELIMRRGDGSFTFAIMQPVETIELIHQLAASVGCHSLLQPRNDFATWRDWKYTEEELLHYRGVQFLPGVGHPPHSNDMAPHMLVGANLPHPEQQSGMPLKEEHDDKTLAIETTKHPRKSKRATRAS